MGRTLIVKYKSTKDRRGESLDGMDVGRLISMR